jgi:uncharacterized membrane protein
LLFLLLSWWLLFSFFDLVYIVVHIVAIVSVVLVLSVRLSPHMRGVQASSQYLGDVRERYKPKRQFRGQEEAVSTRFATPVCWRPRAGARRQVRH